MPQKYTPKHSAGGWKLNKKVLILNAVHVYKLGWHMRRSKLDKYANDGITVVDMLTYYDCLCYSYNHLIACSVMCSICSCQFITDIRLSRLSVWFSCNSLLDISQSYFDHQPHSLLKWCLLCPAQEVVIFERQDNNHQIRTTAFVNHL